MSSYLEIAHYGNLDYNYLGYTSFGVIITILSPSYYSPRSTYGLGTRVFLEGVKENYSYYVYYTRGVHIYIHLH